jgi:hypothetical protein
MHGARGARPDAICSHLGIRHSEREEAFHQRLSLGVGRAGGRGVFEMKRDESLLPGLQALGLRPCGPAQPYKAVATTSSYYIDV